jgi:hypothetical protein
MLSLAILNKHSDDVVTIGRLEIVSCLRYRGRDAGPKRYQPRRSVPLSG